VLAVTNSAINALAMGLATTFVLLASGFLVSLLSKYIPRQVRIATYIVIIATFVTIIDYVIQAISLDLYNALGAFIQLIVVGAGALFGFDLFGPQFQPWVVMVLPPGGFLVLGAWLLLFDWLKQRQQRKQLAVSGGQSNAA